MTRRVDSTITVPNLNSIGRYRIEYNTTQGPYAIAEATKVLYEQHRTQLFSDYSAGDIVTGATETATYYFNLPKQEGYNANYRIVFGCWAKNIGASTRTLIMYNGTYESSFTIETCATPTYFTANIDLDGSDALENRNSVYFECDPNVTIYGFDCWLSGSRETLPSGSYACGIDANLVFPDADYFLDHKPLSIQRYYEVGSVQKFVRNSLINHNVLQACNIATHDTKANYFFIDRPRIPNYRLGVTPSKILNVILYATAGIGQFTGTIDATTKTYDYTTTPHLLTYEIDSLSEFNEETITGSFICKNALLNISAFYVWENNL